MGIKTEQRVGCGKDKGAWERMSHQKVWLVYIGLAVRGATRLKPLVTVAVTDV